MARYRKKPVEIEAVKFTYPPSEELLEFAKGHLGPCNKDRHFGAVGEIVILTLEDGSGNMKATHIATEGDMIIKGVHGEFYACKPDIFEKTYEEINDENTFLKRLKKR